MLLVVVVFVGAAALWYLSANLEGTIWRVLVAAAMFLGIAIFGIGFMRQLTNAPPEPDAGTVPPQFRLAYVCEMCGMELSVIKVAQEKAPRHCGEEMILVRRQLSAAEGEWL